MSDRETGMQTRREVLGDEHVDRATASAGSLRRALPGSDHALRVGRRLVATGYRPPDAQRDHAHRARDPPRRERARHARPRGAAKRPERRRDPRGDPAHRRLRRRTRGERRLRGRAKQVLSEEARSRYRAARRDVWATGAPPRPEVTRRARAPRRRARSRAGRGVAQITVCRSSTAAAASSSATAAAPASSSREVGSSTISSPRALASARASATRWASPADSRATRWRARSDSPTQLSTTAARRARPRALQPRSRKREHDVLLGAQERDRRGLLRQVADAGAPNRRARLGVERSAARGRVERQLARVRDVDAGEQSQQCRLARSRPSGDRGHPPGRELVASRPSITRRRWPRPAAAGERAQDAALQPLRLRLRSPPAERGRSRAPAGPRALAGRASRAARRPARAHAGAISDPAPARATPAGSCSQPPRPRPARPRRPRRSSTTRPSRSRTLRSANSDARRIVGDDDRGRRRGRARARRSAPDRCRADRVELARRLVGEQQRRAVRERRAHGDALALAADSSSAARRRGR